jgi:outer membrane protein assembly factor BamB
MKIVLWMITVGSLLASVVASASDWPEFRGPTRDGRVAEALPTEWAEDKHVVWKTPIHGSGLSTPVICDGKVWLTTATVDGRQMSVLCLDQQSGEVLLDRVLISNDNPEPLSNKINTYASPSAAVEEGRVYLSFGSYGTFCFDTDSFDLLWQRRDLRASHWRGPGSSAALWQDLLVLTFDAADQQYHLALDKLSGKTVWRRDRSTDYDDIDASGRPVNSGDLRKAYSTPIFIQVGEQAQMISCGAKATWAYDPIDGSELWSVHYATHSPSSRPVYSAERKLLLINTGLGKPQLWAVKVDESLSGELEEQHFAWKLTKRVTPRSSPVLVGDLLFMASDSAGSCVDILSGEVLWTERVGGDFSASLIAAGGRVYFFDEAGQGVVTKAARNFELIATNQLDSGMAASPAAADGDLFLRTRTHVYRIGE